MLSVSLSYANLCLFIREFVDMPDSVGIRLLICLDWGGSLFEVGKFISCGVFIYFMLLSFYISLLLTVLLFSNVTLLYMIFNDSIFG